MTDNPATVMPENIWAGIYHSDDEVNSPTAEWRARKITGGTEYIRSDLYEAVCEDLARLHDTLNRYAEDVAVPQDVLAMVGEALRRHAEFHEGVSYYTAYHETISVLKALQPYLSKNLTNQPGNVKNGGES